MRADSTSATVSGFFSQATGIEQRPFARRDRDLGQLLARRAELVHVARGRERVGARRQERLERRLVGIDLAHRGLLAADAALRAAVGDHRDLAEPELDRAMRVRDMKLERRAADDRRVDERRIDAEILGTAPAPTCGSAWWRRTAPSTSFRVRPQSSSARWMPCAIRSIRTCRRRPGRDRIRRRRRSRRCRASSRSSRALRRREDGIGRLVAAGAMDAEAHPQADPAPASGRCPRPGSSGGSLRRSRSARRCTARPSAGCTTVVA